MHNPSLITLLISCIACFLTYTGQCQSITINVINASLSKVLKELQNDYDIEFSGSDKLLTNCVVSIQKTYKSPQKALLALTKNCNLVFKEVEDVFIITEKRVLSKRSNSAPNNQAKPKLKFYTYKGQVIDAISKEPLPFSNLQIEAIQLTTDVNGRFSCQSQDSIASLKISHLGYFLYDSTITFYDLKEIGLYPSITKLKEVVVEANTTIKNIHLGENPGRVKLNHKIASFLPGTGNNSIYSLLRLQPGVLSAGEQTKDYILWGSYKGQSQILFDGITIFNTSSFNNNMGAINPLIIKDVEIFKGGYNVDIGDRVGGFVNITSKSGNKDKFHSAININNQATSSYFNIPIAHFSNLQIAVRTTIPNIFDPKTYDQKSEQKYYFGDLNIKYSIPFKNGDNFSLSLLGNIDNYSDVIEESTDNKDYYTKKSTSKYQLGASTFYGKEWKKIGATHFRASFSRLNTAYLNSIAFNDKQKPNRFLDRSESTANTITEISTRIDHFLPSTKYQNITFGTSLTHNISTFLQDTTNRNLKNNIAQATRFNLYIKDQIKITKYLSIQPGLRIDFPLYHKATPLVQPRIDAIIHPHENWRINLAYGIYNQFIIENTIVDNLGNRLYYWSVDNPNNSEQLQGMHYVAGLSANYQYISFNIEGYYKNLRNLSRFYNDPTTHEVYYSLGESRSYGIDFYLKTEFNRQKIWVTYTLSKTEERFDNISKTDFQRAAHDQRHEFKVAGVFNFNSFFCSINYIFGSGFPSTLNLTSEANVQIYSRLDLAIFYRHKAPKFSLETGFSILNVLNTPNIRYDNFSNFPDNTSKYDLATPFSPSLFINLSF